MNTNYTIQPKSASKAFLSAVLAAVLATSVAAAEDEWYDPSDWFDGNNLEYDDTYDYDYYDYDYDGVYDYGYDWDYWGTAYDDYTWNDWNDYDSWGVDIWDDTYYDVAYWDDYDWYDDYDALDDVDVTGVYSYDVGTSEALQPTGRMQQSGQNQQQQNEPATLRGTITGLSSMNLKRESGATGIFTIAQVKLENGKTAVVNLGRQSQLTDLTLKQGDKIRAIGQQGRIQGRTVFVAQWLEANGQRIHANPVIRLRGDSRVASNQQRSRQSMRQSTERSNRQTAQQSGRQQNQQQTIQGEVARVSRVMPSGTNAEHTLIQLKLENGRNATVDLGPSVSLDRIGLDRGDNITVRGRRDRVEGRSVIVAQLLKIDGERVSSNSR